MSGDLSAGVDATGKKIRNTPMPSGASIATTERMAALIVLGALAYLFIVRRSFRSIMT